MLEETVEGETLETYKRDVVLRFATQRAVEIISVASRSLPDEAKKLGDNIPWRKIGGMGNILRHEYFTVSDIVIWETITDDLPALKSALRRMLEE
jgi:uncharacterized protein with HEPN domain